MKNRKENVQQRKANLEWPKTNCPLSGTEKKGYFIAESEQIKGSKKEQVNHQKLELKASFKQ